MGALKLKLAYHSILEVISWNGCDIFADFYTCICVGGDTMEYAQSNGELGFYILKAYHQNAAALEGRRKVARGR